MMNEAFASFQSCFATLFSVMFEQYSIDSNSGPNNQRDRRISGCRVWSSSVSGSSASLLMASMTLSRPSISSSTRRASLTDQSAKRESSPSISEAGMFASLVSKDAPLLDFSRLITAFTAVARKSGDTHSKAAILPPAMAQTTGRPAISKQKNARKRIITVMAVLRCEPIASDASRPTGQASSQR
ncbi:ADP-heptose:LPS heptosyltransferase [Pseudomonas syringae pv. actinidiae]|uniref:ADP-heptose:LPS heptosyltransferase n=1 Tax=Pseudomonas syringae pv. actinidiae TaxID=103796 RepID=A0A2V0QIH5_PSESF|nr:ADP-heptose:LPS heptosyltransferase [Pseudomonas syringae pv. actinidiae]